MFISNSLKKAELIGDRGKEYGDYLLKDLLHGSHIGCRFHRLGINGKTIWEADGVKNDDQIPIGVKELLSEILGKGNLTIIPL